MDTESVLTIIGMLLTTLISIGGAAVVTMSRIAKIEVKVDTLWTILFQRGVVETVSRGLGTVNSPLEISSEVRTLFQGVANELRKFYQRTGRYAVSDMELAIGIQRVFGDRLFQICIDNKLPPEAAVLIAAAIAKGQDKVEVP